MPPQSTILGEAIATSIQTRCQMSTNHTQTFPPHTSFGRADTVAAAPARQAYQILHFAFVAAPVIAGLDKFFHLLVNWDQYLAPWIANLSPIPTHSLMLVVGVVEIAAGLVVAI